MLSEKRLPRRGLRALVVFWRRGQESEAVSGYSLNVSTGGMFVATYRPLPPNAPVELKIDLPDKSIRASARVMHAARYPAQFARIMKSGMGIRFSHPEKSTLQEMAQRGQLLPDRRGCRRLPQLVSMSNRPQGTKRPNS